MYVDRRTDCDRLVDSSKDNTTKRLLVIESITHNHAGRIHVFLATINYESLPVASLTTIEQRMCFDRVRNYDIILLKDQMHVLKYGIVMKILIELFLLNE